MTNFKKYSSSFYRDNEKSKNVRNKSISKMNHSSEKWILKYIVITVLLSAVYFFTHFIQSGNETIYLTEDQRTFIQNLKDSFDDEVQNISIEKGSSSKVQYDSIINQNLRLIDNYINCCIKDSISISSYQEAFEYLQKENFRLFLNDFSWTRKSFFWLDSNLVIVEIIFWSFIGVLCSLLFHGSEAIRLNNFDPKELAIHYSKLTYSPIITLIIIFSGNVLIHDGSINVDGLTYWVIVLSFILGFYSRRTIDLLDRIKDLVFRSSPTKRDSENTELIVTGKLVFNNTISNPPVNALSNAAIAIVSLSDHLVPPQLLKTDNGSFEVTIVKAGTYKMTASLTIDDKSYEGSNELILDNLNPIEEQTIALKEL